MRKKILAVLLALSTLAWLAWAYTTLSAGFCSSRGDFLPGSCDTKLLIILSVVVIPLLMAAWLLYYEKRERKRDQERTALVMAKVLESVNGTAKGHSTRLSDIVDALSRRLSLGAKEKEAVVLAARLSQMGKTFVPEAVLMKKGRLTAEERAAVSKGMKKGAELVGSMGFSPEVEEPLSELASGEPKNVPGKILVLANAYVAMTGERPWRGSAIDKDSAIMLLRDDGRFSTKMVDALAEVTEIWVSGVL